MSVKKYRPMSAGRRNSSVVDYRSLDKVDPLSSLLTKKKSSGGRNNLGRITVRHRGGGAKRLYRLIDFKRSIKDIRGRVEYIEYDPNRTAFIARVVYDNGVRKYIIAPDKLKKGDDVISSDKSIDPNIGVSLRLKDIPLGMFVHNIELKPGKGGQIARSAGACAQIVGKVDNYCQVKLPSGEMRKILNICSATIGVVGNLDNSNTRIGKAGRKRHLGIRPTVRGVAMNPVDHPHGGGEGKTSGGRHPVSPWAVLSKGFKTRKNKRTDKFIIKKRK